MSSPTSSPVFPVDRSGWDQTHGMRSDSIRGAVRGVAAAAVGTLAMDLLWHARYRRGGGEDGFADWELSRGTTGFEHAGTPAQVGRRLAQKVAHIELPDNRAALTNNVVHWATGLQWGAAYGVVAALAGKPGLRSGAALGVVACSTSYALLPLLGLYQPIWTYDARTLAQDYSAHLVFGTVTGAGLWVLRAGPDRSLSGG